MNAATSQSELERAAVPLTPDAILRRLSGCAPCLRGRYAATLAEVSPRLAWAGPQRLAATSSVYADPLLRQEKLAEYVWTEYWGGVFIEDFLRDYRGEYAKLLTRHALDEVGHGNAFAQYAGRPAPSPAGAPEGLLARDAYAAYQQWANGDLVAFLSILHVLELRTAVILTHWFCLLETYPGPDRDAIHSLLARISRDEVFHLTYTLQALDALLVDDAASRTLTEAFMLSEADVPTILDAARRRREGAHA
ncbi:hypothetical protein CDN99_17875 [Roseateles aquatilis]|uniref:Ferritin n=1 Tax=Roseateles aquatilis TaxID=431061 RepID=A0A246J4H5_9BURK|nr:hypothetical protein [Roseateles aquatilis]OWQ87473.1 hypothetical protein CDN99_17875 [Roseateles aquatilis]